MSEYHGDVDLGDTIQWLFTTVDSTGLPTVLTGTPTATAYTDGGITQSATGVTLTASFDGVTGLNLISIVASSGNGFAAGENIEIVLDAGTVGGVSVVGYAVGGFSIANRSPLRPTTAGNTLDVTATGAAGIDWANVENPTTVVDLSGTDINLVDTTTTNTDMRGTDSALLAASAPANFGDLSITVTTGLVDITQAAADKVWATASRLLTAGTNIVLAKGVGVTGFNDIPATDVVSAGAITTLAGAVVNVDTVDSVTGAVGSVTGSVTVGTNSDKTGYSIASGGIAAAAFAANAIDAAALATDAVTEIRDSILPTSNTTLNNIPFLFVAASDHVTPVTGATGTAVTRSIDGGAFGAGTGALAEVANGIYQYDASAADMNGGIITFRFTATGGTPGAPDDAFVTIFTGAGV